MTPVGQGVPVNPLGPTLKQPQLDEIMDQLSALGVSGRGVSLLLGLCRRVVDMIPRSDMPHGPRVSVGAEARSLLQTVMSSQSLPAPDTVHELLNRYYELPPDCTLLYDCRSGCILKVVRIRKS